MRQPTTLVGAVLVLGLCAGAAATVLHVPGEYPAIQAGIDAAVDGDTVLVAEGVYYERLNFLGKKILVTSEYLYTGNIQTIENTIIDADTAVVGMADTASVVIFCSGETSDAVIRGFTIQSGQGYKNEYDRWLGGGIMCINSSPTVIHNVVRRNHAVHNGGGLCGIDSSNATVTYNTFTENSSGAGGGMMFSQSRPVITYNEIVGNVADTTGYPTVMTMGGGVFTYKCVSTIMHNTIRENTASIGGGVCSYVLDSDTISQNEIRFNSAVGDSGIGGGISCFHTFSGAITDNVITDNSASGDGGGIHLYLSNVIPGMGGAVHSNVLTRNRAGANGGGIYLKNFNNGSIAGNVVSENVAPSGGGGGIGFWNCSIPVCGNTITSNTAFKGGGLYAYANIQIVIDVLNSICWRDTGTWMGDEIYGELMASFSVGYSDVDGGWPGPGNIDLDPMFVLADRGDYRLLWGSPCVDAGHPDSLDPDGTRSDMGAHYFDQDDYVTLYLTPDTTEVSPGGALGVTYTAINRWTEPEPFWVLTDAIMPNGNSRGIMGPDHYTLPAQATVQHHLYHDVPLAAPPGLYGYRSRIGVPPSTLYDEDTFEFVVSSGAGQWKPYGHRYAIVVMGGNVSGQMYRWYWNDTSGKVWTLMDWGFAPEDIIYLSYGDSANVHPELVDDISTKANVQAAFDTVAAKVTQDDLVHVWWVDHGNTSGFEVHNGFVYFTELRDWIDNIECRAYIGAYNPCYSGAIMSHMQGLCSDERRVITATSVRANQPNSYGWAGMWRLAMRGGYPDNVVPSSSDRNGDGYIALDEAYEWETPHSNAASPPEYPLFDDNGDGIGGDLTNPAIYDSTGQDSTKDGFCGQFYNLMAWYDEVATDGGPCPFLPSSLADTGQRLESPREEIEIEWSIGQPVPTPVCRGASGLVGDKIYLFGGLPSPAPVHYAYDIGGESWSEDVQALPIHGSNVRGVVYDGKFYVFGGHTLGSDTMRRYDPAADAWEMLSSPYPSGRFECCKYGAAAVGNNIYYYYMEQRYSYRPVQVFWEYDILGDSWIEMSAPPEPKRMYVASASDGTYCYAAGGLSHEDLSPISDVIRYDPALESWEAIDPLPEPVAFADGDFLREYLVIAGGGAGYGPWPASDRVHVWKEGEGWMSATPLPAPVGIPHVELATIDATDYIFVFGGYNEGYLSSVYIGQIQNLE